MQDKGAHAPNLPMKRSDEDRQDLTRSGSPLFGKAPVLSELYELAVSPPNGPNGGNGATGANVHELGSGTYGMVTTGRSRKDGKPVALKRMNLPSMEQGQKRLDHEIYTMREVDTLRRVGDHPNIIQLLDVCRDTNNNVYLVFDLIDNDLLGILNYAASSHLMANQISGYMKDLFEALAYIHEHHIMHRDVKCDNILVTRDGLVKLADFGMARDYHDRDAVMAEYPRYTNPVQTLHGRAPELLLGSTEYTERIDIWAAMCVVLECVLRKPMLPGNTDDGQLKLIFELCGTPRDVRRDWPHELHAPIQTALQRLRIPAPLASRIRARLSPEHIKWRRDLFTEELVQLVEAGLEMNPRRRPSAKELLTQPWFKGAYPPALRTRFPSGQRTVKVIAELKARDHHERQDKHAKK